MAPSPEPTQYTAFRLAERYYKNRSVQGVYPSLLNRGVVDLSHPQNQEDDPVWRAGWWAPPSAHPRRLRKGKERERGERPAEDYAHLQRITLASGKEAWLVAPGCILLPRYLDEASQLELARAALADYTRPPNPLSLSTHYDLPPDLFERYIRDSPDLIPPIYATLSPEDRERARLAAMENQGPRKVIETLPGAVVGYEQVLRANRETLGMAPSEAVKPKTAERLMRELRWANLGWVYQWSTKAYDFTPETPIEFPKPLAAICQSIVRNIPWAEVFSADPSAPEDWSKWQEDYTPDTGIVNFYQLNDTLMGHVDRAELDPSRPLVSISLGHSAIFLLGTESREDEPLPILLRSGDVLVMSGQGRRAYHGVPRIMEGTLPSHFEPDHNDEETMAGVKRFMGTARVNINTRQVFPPGFQRPAVNQAVIEVCS